MFHAHNTDILRWGFAFHYAWCLELYKMCVICHSNSCLFIGISRWWSIFLFIHIKALSMNCFNVHCLIQLNSSNVCLISNIDTQSLVARKSWQLIFSPDDLLSKCLVSTLNINFYHQVLKLILICGVKQILQPWPVTLEPGSVALRGIL